MSGADLQTCVKLIEERRALEALETCAALRRDGRASSDVMRMEVIASNMAGRPEVARDRARRVLAARPEDARMHLELARAHTRCGEAQAAAHAYRAYVRHGGRLADVAEPLARVLLDLGRTGEALEILEAATREAGGHAAAQAGIAEALIRQGRVSDARRAAEQALRLDGKDPRALRADALVRLRQGRWPEAHESAAAALSQAPNYGLALSLRGVARYKLGRLEEGLGDARRATRIAPHQGAAWLNLAKLLAAHGETAPAHHACERAVGLAPGLRAAWRLLSDLERAERPEKAIDAAERAVKAEDTADARAYVALLERLLEAGHLEAAERWCSTGLEACPESAALWRLGSRVAARRDEWGQAIARGEAADELEPDPAEADRIIGLMRRADRREDLERLLDRFLADPLRAWEAYCCGQALYEIAGDAPVKAAARRRAGATDEARALLQAVLVGGRGDHGRAFDRIRALGDTPREGTTVALLRAHLARRAGRLDLAELWCRRSLNATPLCGRTREELADVLIARERYSEAAEVARDAWVRRRTARAGIARAVALKQIGETATAVGVLEAVCEASPDNALAWCQLAVVAAEMEREEQADAAAARAIDLDGRTGRALYARSVVRARFDDLDQAISDARAAVAAEPEANRYRVQLAQLLFEGGDAEQAVSELKGVLEAVPSDPQANDQLALILTQQGHGEEAARYRAAAGDGRGASAQDQLAHARLLERAGHLDEARRTLERAQSLAPDTVQVLVRLARLDIKTDRADQARATAQRAIQQDPQSPDALAVYAEALKAAGDFKGATNAFRRAVQVRPDFAEGHVKLGLLLNDQGRPDLAEGAFMRAKAAAPRGVGAYINLGNILKDTGRVEEALAEYRKAQAIQPGLAVTDTNVLLAMQYLDRLTPEDFRREAEAWDSRHGQVEPVQRTRPMSDPGGKIRVGYVSGSFRRHPVGWLTLRAIEARNPKGQEVHLFNVPDAPEDAITKRYRKAVDGWHDVGRMSAEALARYIADQGIDILVDLTGHAKGARLTTFARRPAPVQVKWVGGQFGTMGMRAMDWFLTDPVASPPEADAYHTERLYRLPDCYVCYGPPGYAPDPGPLPADTNGFVTFCCFNNVAKLTPRTIALWAQILRGCPGARLILKTHVLRGQWTADRLRGLFREHDIDPDRLDIRPGGGHKELLSTYREADVALDPMPYNGGLTTLEALWMGVPVLTRAGKVFCARHSATHLTAAGLADWVAESDAAYVDKGIAAARDLDGLRELRGRLRGIVKDSPLCDAKRFARNLDAAYRHMLEAAR